MEIRNEKQSATADSPVNKSSFIRRYLPDEKPIGLLVIFVILCAGLIVGLTYKPKPKSEVKSVQLAGISIVNKDKTSASKQLSKATTAQKINLVIKDKSYTYSDKDLGIKRDVSSLLDTAYAPPDSIINNRIANKGKGASLKTYVQKKRLISAIDQTLGDSKTIQNASVSVNGGSLIVNPGRPGLNINYDQLIRQLEQSDLKSSLTITANFTQQEPQIPTEAAAAAKSKAETMIKPDYGVNTQAGNTRYASLAQKASWLVFTPDPSTHKISAAINVVAARNTIAKVAQGFAQSPQNRVTLTSTDGSTTVLDEGQPGLAVDQNSVNDGLNKFAVAIVAQQSYTLPLVVASQPQGDRNLGTSTGGKFVLVDVAAYRAYAINNTTVDRTMVVSTGRPGLETPKGHFNILRKTKLITMSGCNKLAGCWTVPNVPNAEFFTNDGDALHGTYWYINWGHQNASHGCVNLHLDDAAWLFDWTSVGTDVIVV
jgi:lipoprotein-anchoring transpeptidase ErfK/SrfK